MSKLKGRMRRARKRRQTVTKGERGLKKGRMKWVRLSKMDTKEHRTKEESNRWIRGSYRPENRSMGKWKAPVEEKGSI